MKIENARILITGGSLGIGRATAQKLSGKGAKVLITGRNEERLKKAAKEIKCEYVVADVAKDDDIEKTYRAVDEKLGGLDVLINNAGIGLHTSLDEIKREDFRAVFEVNVFGAAVMARYAAERFKKQGGGTIINVGSTAARKGYKGGTVYSASKFALTSMTESWRAELREHNIRIMQVNPSSVMTAFGQEDREERPEKPNRLRGEEIAHAIESMLTMDDRGFITELAVWATNPFE